MTADTRPVDAMAAEYMVRHGDYPPMTTYAQDDWRPWPTYRQATLPGLAPDPLADAMAEHRRALTLGRV